MMKGRSILVRPKDWAAMVSVVSTIVAAKPHNRIDGRFIRLTTASTLGVRYGRPSTPTGATPSETFQRSPRLLNDPKGKGLEPRSLSRLRSEEKLRPLSPRSCT